jgi:hypothetical protein
VEQEGKVKEGEDKGRKNGNGYYEKLENCQGP